MKISTAGSDIVGVVYHFHPANKINGTLFYCAEYYAMLRSLGVPTHLYLVGITNNDLYRVRKIFEEKYTVRIDPVAIRQTDLYIINLKKTLILDVRTFYNLKELLTGDVHVFSNEAHDMWRYANSRSVTYYGSYYYQRYDIFNYLKLNFDIFKPVTTKKHQVLVSSIDPELVELRRNEYEERFNRPIIRKSNVVGRGDIFGQVDHVHYVHTKLDTNNRTIPESFFHDTPITIEESGRPPHDSIMMRYVDITTNGLDNYTLTKDDRMIQACQQ